MSDKRNDLERVTTLGNRGKTMKTMLKIMTVTALVAFAVPQAQAHCGACGTESHDHDHAEAKQDIVDTAVAAGDFKTLAAALTAANLIDALKGEGPFTVFAPTDAAFAKLPEGTVESLLKPENRDQLTAILTYHVVSGQLKAEEVVMRNSAKTLNGEKITIQTSDQGVRINGAKVLATDILASNGVIHVIDSVLLPPEENASRASASELIQMAINKGAPMYNHGNHAACAAIYEMAATSILALETDLPSEARMALSNALVEMKGSHDSADQAWIMRRGLDSAYTAMQMDLASR